jgi:hypothetical protein
MAIFWACAAVARAIAPKVTRADRDFLRVMNRLLEERDPKSPIEGRSFESVIPRRGIAAIGKPAATY